MAEIIDMKAETNNTQSFKRENIEQQMEEAEEAKQIKETPPPTPEQMKQMVIQQEDPQRRKELVKEITDWVTHKRLGRFLTEYRMIDFSVLTIQDLESTMADIRYSVSCKTNSSNMEEGFKKSTIVIENMVNRFSSMDVTGYSHIMNNDDRVLDTVAEISMDFRNLQHVSPYKRLVFYMVSGIITTNAINQAVKANNTMNDMLNKQIDTNTIHSYSDL